MTQRSMMQSALPHSVNHLSPRKSPEARPWVPIAQTTLYSSGILLLVCEEELTRRVLKVVLETAGYRVVEALSINEGMRQCAPRQKRPDLAVVVSVLESGTWASLDILRSALDHVPLLVMSPDEVGWLMEALDGNEMGFHGQWLARVQSALQEGSLELASTLNLA